MNEINLEKTKRKLKARGVIISEQELFIDVLRIFSVPPDEGGFVLEVHCKLPATFPLLSLDTRREIECNSKETFTGYYIDVYALSKLTRVGLKSQQKTVLGRNVCGEFGYHVRSNSEGRALLSFWIEEAVILEESRRLTTCGIWWVISANRVLVSTNYGIITINDAETPIHCTNLIKKFQTYEQVRIDAHKHKIYKLKQPGSASSIAEAVVKGQVVRKRDITYKGLQLFGVGIRFPLDKTNSFYFIFTEGRSE